MLYPTDDDPFHVICGYSPSNEYFHLYEIDIGNLTLLTQKPSRWVDLTGPEFKGSYQLPNELMSKIMWQMILDMLDTKDPGKALEYAYLNKATLKYVYYQLFGSSSSLKYVIPADQCWYMVKRIANYMRLLYRITERLESNYIDNLVNNQITFKIKYSYLTLFVAREEVLYPFMLELVDGQEDYMIHAEWRCMIPDEGVVVGGGYTPWCKGYETRGIWKVYELAWPLILVDYKLFPGISVKQDERAFKIFFDLISLMFGRYTVIKETSNK